jgi:hypothetical protein
MSISLCNMQDSSTLFLSCTLRCFDAGVCERERKREREGGREWKKARKREGVRVSACTREGRRDGGRDGGTEKGGGGEEGGGGGRDCLPIVHAYIATNKLVVHACRSTSLSIVYIIGALLVYMNIRCYHACFRYFNACPPIVHAYITTILLIKHACMSISLSNMHVNDAF